MEFDKNKSKLAVTIPRFGLRKKHKELFEGKYLEPYILSLAVDAKGANNPAIGFNLMPFPKVAPGSCVEMMGDGHLVYGPANPGEFLAISVLIMEADHDIRNAGKDLQSFIKSKAVDLGMKAVIVAHPGAAAALGILKELTQFTAGLLKENKDDELFRVSGTFLRDGIVPYHINRKYQYGNDYAEVDIKILPLPKANGQGSSVVKIAL